MMEMHRAGVFINSPSESQIEFRTVRAKSTVSTILVALDEVDGLTREGVGQVFRLLDALSTPQHPVPTSATAPEVEVGVERSEKAIEFIEALLEGMELRFLSKVPLAKGAKDRNGASRPRDDSCRKRGHTGRR